MNQPKYRSFSRSNERVQPGFVHEELLRRDRSLHREPLVLSKCAICGVCIGASSNPELLDLVEGLHRCSASPKPIAGAA